MAGWGGFTRHLRSGSVFWGDSDSRLERRCGVQISRLYHLLLNAPLLQPSASTRPGDGSRAHLITFTCYGTRLHGDEDGFVDRCHSRPFTLPLEENPGREEFERGLSKHVVVTLATKERAIVLERSGSRLSTTDGCWTPHMSDRTMFIPSSKPTFHPKR